MSKRNKMIMCKTCNNPMAAKAKICPSCGAKNKKPIYKRGWFIVLAIILVLGVAGSVDGGNKNKSERIEIKKPEEVSETTPPNSTIDASEDLPAREPETVSDTTTELVNGMRPEFKEAMDSYEAFYDEYCAFMKEYSDNPTDVTLLSKYANMLTKLAEMDSKFEAWDSENLNDAELKYYLEVSNRITSKLLDIAE